MDEALTDATRSRPERDLLKDSGECSYGPAVSGAVVRGFSAQDLREFTMVREG